MAFDIDENGTITCYQGDSGEINITGLSTDENYTLYFAVQDTKRKPVGFEVSVETDYKDTATFVITPELSDTWVVKPNEEFATYYYGVKQCDGKGFEDTLSIAGSTYGDYSEIHVYPKKVEGTV